MKKILIIGGTSFIGRHLLNYLLEQEEYEISLFNRGVTNPELFPELNRIKGDRNVLTEISQIFAEKWDCIVDLSCYYPQSLAWILNGVNKQVNYIFISTCSVYDNEQYSGMYRDETAPRLSCTTAEGLDQSPATYGRRKAACERLLENSGVRYTIFRPALVFGSYDPTDRFYYWLHQVKTKKLIGIPENGKRKFSLTYVGDLLSAMVAAIHMKPNNQVYNCISYKGMSIQQIVDEAILAMERQVETLNFSKGFLVKHQIAPWVDIPVWLNTDDYSYSNEKICNDLDFTPTKFKESIQKTITYYQEISFPTPITGMNEEKQQALLEAKRAED